MKIWALFYGYALANTAADPRGKSPQHRLNRAKRFLNKWIDENVDERYRRFKKLHLRKKDYIKKMGWALDSPCSKAYVDNKSDDEVDRELDDMDAEEAIGARADMVVSLDKKLSNGMKIINTFKKIARNNLSDCERKPVLNTKVEKLRQAIRKAATQTDKLLRKKGAANWRG